MMTFQSQPTRQSKQTPQFKFPKLHFSLRGLFALAVMWFTLFATTYASAADPAVDLQSWLREYFNSQDLDAGETPSNSYRPSFENNYERYQTERYTPDRYQPDKYKSDLYDWRREHGLDQVEAPRYQSRRPQYDNYDWNDPNRGMYERLKYERERNQRPVYQPTRYEAPQRPAYEPLPQLQNKPAQYKPEYKPQPPASTTNPEVDIQQRLAVRYGNPVVGRFIMGNSTQQTLALYQETSRLIDSRHIEPASYAKRTARAIANLSHAVENPEFLAANHLSPSRQQINSFQSQLHQIKQTNPVRNGSEALSLIYKVINLAQQNLGLRGSTVVTEFVYASTETLDKYSAFVPEDSYRKPSATLEDHIVGIGVEIKPGDNGVEVVRPLRGGPAERGGLQKGDFITSINNQNTSGQSLDWVVDQIKGPEGSRLQVGINRNGRNMNVTLVRARVTLHSVSEVRMIDGQVGYIKLEKFAKSTTEEMDKALWDLHRQGMKELVFDLRGNPGGLLTTAIELSDKFLTSGNIVSTRGRTAADMSSETASYEQTWKTPLVVLVDKNSASASEIFAAAIQENGRGLVVGERSYGKGTVQTHFPLQSTAGNLRITTAKFYSPKGREMAGSGVTPDVEVQTDRFTTATGTDRVLETAVSTVRSQQSHDLAGSKSRQQSFPTLSSY